MKRKPMKANDTRIMKVIMWPFIIMSRIQVTPRPSEVAENRWKGPTEELPVSQNTQLPTGSRFKRSPKNNNLGPWFCCCCFVDKSCPSLCDPMDCSPPGSSVHGICQARILEWVAISFSGGSSQSRMEPASLALIGRFFTPEPPGKPQSMTLLLLLLLLSRFSRVRLCATL